MSQAYDTLMDQLAVLAVSAVQHVDIALHAYWLALSSALWQQRDVLPLGTFLRTAQAGTILPLPAWTMPYAPGALASLLHQGVWYESTMTGRLPHKQRYTWDRLHDYADVLLSCPPLQAPYLPDLHREAWLLWPAAESLYNPETRVLRDIPREVLQGVVLFEAGLYFACHEYFEFLWGRHGDTASDFYQGLIQVAVAMRHLESHNVRGAITLLHYGAQRLQRYPEVYKGLQLATFVQRLQALRTSLEGLAEPTVYQFDAAVVPRLLQGTQQGEASAVRGEDRPGDRQFTRHRTRYRPTPGT